MLTATQDLHHAPHRLRRSLTHPAVLALSLTCIDRTAALRTK